MKLIVISPEEYFPQEHLIMSMLFEAGLYRYHIRKPGFSAAEMQAFILNTDKALFPFLSLHSHYTLASGYGPGGVHLPSYIKNKDEACTQFRAEEKIISTSFHHPSEVRKEAGRYEYAFLSPFYPSISKPGYRPSFAHEEVIPLLQDTALNSRLFALGGIDEGHIEEIAAMGFGGAALSGAIWNAPSPAEKFKTMIALCRQLNHTY